MFKRKEKEKRKAEAIADYVEQSNKFWWELTKERIAGEIEPLKEQIAALETVVKKLTALVSEVQERRRNAGSTQDAENYINHSATL